MTILAAEHVIRSLAAEVTALGNEIESLSRELSQIASGASWTTSPPSSGADDDGLIASTATGNNHIISPEKLASLVMQVDIRLQVECLEANGGLLKTIMQGGRTRAQLTSKLREFSHASALGAFGRPELRNGADWATEGQEHLSAVTHATPPFLEYGGRRRVLTVIPSPTAPESAPQSDQAPSSTSTVIAANKYGTTVCVEADGLSPRHVALDLVEFRKDRVEFASRVHSRNDIQWIPLVSTETTRDSAVWDEDSRMVPQVQAATGKTLVM